MNVIARLKSNERKWEAVTCFGMIALPLIGLLVFQLYPILWTVVTSFYSYDGAPSRTAFIGWQNYINMFTKDFTYWKVWANTLEFAIYKIPIEMALALFLACMLKRNIHGKGFFRAMFYLPNVISEVVIGLILSNLFTYDGFMNGVLIKLGLAQNGIEWFSNKFSSMSVLVFGSIWNSFGANVLWFIVALANVPEECYEAAKIDGANAWTTFWKITIPLISKVFSTILLLSMLGTLGINAYILALSGGAPAGETYTVMSYLTAKFVPGFADAGAPIGYGCAMSVITTFLFAFVGIIYNKVNKRANSMF